MRVLINSIGIDLHGVTWYNPREVVGVLENFEVFHTTSTGAVASFTKNGVTFNKVSAERMNKAQFVTLYINRASGQFAVKQCAQNDANAMPFVAAIKPKNPSIRWNNKEFLRFASEFAGWDLENCKGYKVVGEYLKAEKALLFDLTKAIPIV